MVDVVAGVDEAGRGPLAGPVVAAACVLPDGYTHKFITDSKKLSAKKREEYFTEITREAVQYSIVAVGPRRIEELNIREATKLAMKLAIERVSATRVLIDGNMLVGSGRNEEAIVGGDSKILAILCGFHTG